MESSAYKIVNDTIILERELTELDIFVKDFLEILKKYTSYLIVSGYVSISTGRTRGTEDVDCLIQIMPKEKLEELFNDLLKNNFWCYQAEVFADLKKYLSSKDNIRFARINELFPNMELIFVDKSKPLQLFELKNPQKIKIKDFLFMIPPIEFEIAYKENILAGKKDILDAKHLREFFLEYISEEKLRSFAKLIKETKNEKSI